MSSLEFNKELKVKTTNIPGLLIVDLPVYGDSQGWLKENWQNHKMSSMGLPEFSPVQNNITFNAQKGATHGIHAEPWDKYISVSSGRVFGAWVDLREGESFGKVFTAELDPTKAIFVPRGVGNSIQTLENNTVYSYLVNESWSSESQSKYIFLDLADKTIDIKWPIPLDQAVVPDRDKNRPSLSEIQPMKPRLTLITGANGQLGHALQVEFLDAEFTDLTELDITDKNLATARNWHQYETIINAAAYTAVDKAETTEGRKAAWMVNAQAVANLSKIAAKHNITLVHISNDYVFDGTTDNHTEDEPLSPLGVYAQTKAAGDISAAMTKRHYIIRTSWVVGDGNNFVQTMASLAKRDMKSSVISDQTGRLSFTSDIAKGIKHLITTKSPYGTYNLTGDGQSASWYDIAKEIYQTLGKSLDNITPVTTAEYFAGKSDISPRPMLSTLDLTKIKGVSFYPTDWHQSLAEYLKEA